MIIQFDAMAEVEMVRLVFKFSCGDWSRREVSFVDVCELTVPKSSYDSIKNTFKVGIGLDH